MCGIAGIVYPDRNRRVSADRLKRMANAIAHRGPDDEGFYLGDGGVGLAHRRLSIIDLAGGSQPMGNETGSIQIVFNGEIYNFPELRRQLIGRGHVFRTHSDTETIVHLYEERGKDLVHDLRGMFAFALWDSRQRALLLARDRLGQKPLYFAFDDEKLLFGSELKAILAYGGIPRGIDPCALEDYLAFGFVPGTRTILRGIRKLLPASMVCLDADRWQLRERCYWKLAGEVHRERKLDEWQEELRSKLSETIAAHRIADVPVGCFLSGGLDSSAVTAVLARNGDEPVRTFSIGFTEKRFSELEYARLVAEKYQTVHTEATVSSSALASLDSLTTYYDEPFADASAVPTMHVASLASKQVKVVLSGDGGDEGFGGYSRYAHDLREAAVRRNLPAWLRSSVVKPSAGIWPKADWLPRFLRMKTLLTNLSLEPAEAYANTLQICRNPVRRQLLAAEVRRQLGGYRSEDQVMEGFGSRADDPLRGMIAADLSLMLPGDYLTKVDRASMAFGLEVRTPLVDHEWMELAWSVPSELKIRNGTTKWILKKTCEPWLPHDIIYRGKQGFETPIDAWVRKPLRGVFHSVVLSPSAPIGNYLDLAVVRKLYAMHCQQVARYGNLLWAILVLAAWMERYLPAASENRLCETEAPSSQVLMR
ncbi:asparagine synthase (glutamine-hydrolyzing) [Candidatus Laterigemmans baculatus]|uniref:asparagine synthase (glutamine-hydrolyzing) n=1 Tax=Candidatus Laterigemmans baculatus TaxID=2770505 RepID=UPI0013D8F739|nr:asparagine synthase (glutamine-hydrolyzing) [Candidatus Laterigemmans baculatus]